jgi:site-specific DNA recombinase
MSRSPAPPKSDSQRPIRCAIYTRKSTSEGLDQAFNSLDAQREAGESFIASQKHAGWIALKDRYDDGGYSGGNAERPAVQRLLADIEAGKIDCVVVYKVDRLSRSLLDFARMMALFEEMGVHFVSVTQHFNTAESMGRLTLNILLSFAQFEREIISERTRDKIAAAKKRGQWSGGRPILGYDLDRPNKRLVVNNQEAWQVKAIFDTYVQKESLLPALAALNQQGFRTKAWVDAKERSHGGQPFDKSTLHHLLNNIAYLGRVRHRKENYAGLHPAIIDEPLFNRVQKLLNRNRVHRGACMRNRHGALLKGLLRCAACDSAMAHIVSCKGNKRYRYYACCKAMKRGLGSCPTSTVPAGIIESAVVEQLRRLVQEVHLEDGPIDGAQKILETAWDDVAAQEQARILRLLVREVIYDRASINRR